MASKAQLFCGLSGILFVVVMGVGLGPIAQMSPPPPATITGGEIAATFRQSGNAILTGAFLANIAVALSVALVVGIFVQMRRMDPPETPVLSYLQLASGTVASLFLMLPVMIWNVAAFRPERSQETLLMLHDLASFATFIPFSVATIEAWAIGAAILSDSRDSPAFPKWLGYFNILAGLSYIPMGVVGFHKTGLFASDGLLGWWLPTGLVLPWYALMGFYVIRAEQAHARSRDRA